MNINASQVKDIKAAFAKLQPEKVTLNGTRNLTVKEAVFALAPTLERMKKRGFDTEEIAGKLHEKGIDVKPPTLAKYLNEFRRGKEQGKGQKKDTPRPSEKTLPALYQGKPVSVNRGVCAVTPDTPLEDL